MQRFALFHDGTHAGWHAAYLAFHVAAQLGAPLRVLLMDSASSQADRIQQSAQIETGGRAAGVPIETQLVNGFSAATLTKYAHAMDGVFTPRRLVPDGKAAAQISDSLACPLWVVLKESSKQKMAVIIRDENAVPELIQYTKTLSQRLQQTLIGLIGDDESEPNPFTDPTIPTVYIPSLSSVHILHALEDQGADILFIPSSNSSLMDDLTVNCVIYPARHEA